MSDYKITQRYAKALLELSLTENKIETVSKDLDFFLRTLLGYRPLQLALKSPIIRKEKKAAIVEQIFKDKISDLTLSFIKLVINRQRAELLESIIQRFFIMRDERLNLKTVIIYTPFNLDENQLNHLKKMLEEYTGKKVNLIEKIDKSLIGGVIIQIDDTIINGSIKHILENLKKRFLTGIISLN